MSNIDKKLEEIIVRAPNEDGYVEDKTGAAEQIKAVFVEEGWLDTTQLGGIKSTTICRPEGNIEFMVGQEWLDRFEKQIGMGDLLIADEHICPDDIQAAARKASGQTDA